MEECVLRVADVDEGGFEAGIQVFDTALVDGADHAVVGLAFDFEFLEAAVDEEGDAFFQRLGIDDELAVGTFFLLEDGENFLKEGALFGALGGAGFELGGGDGRGLSGSRCVDEFFVVFAGNVRRGAGMG